MGKRVKNAVMTATGGAATVASIKDLGTQFATLGARGKTLAEAALKIWPALGKDFAKGDRDNWAEFDKGARLAYDASHTAPVAVRNERGQYSLVAAGEGVEGTHVTAAYLSGLSSAQWATFKNDSPTLWTALDSVRDKVQAYVRDNRRNLRDNVKKVTGGVSRKARHGNRTAFEVIKDTIEALKAKVKLDQSHKQLDQSQVDRITAWLLDGEKLIKS